MSAELENILKHAALTVFKTMLNTTPEFSDFEGDFLNGEERVACSVGITGALNGMIHFYSGAALARRFACRMLSMSEAELQGHEMVNDVMGELTNMLAGQIKVKLHQSGAQCLLTVPTVMRGSNVRTVATGRSKRSNSSTAANAALRNASLTSTSSSTPRLATDEAVTIAPFTSSPDATSITRTAISTLARPSSSRTERTLPVTISRAATAEPSCNKSRLSSG